MGGNQEEDARSRGPRRGPRSRMVSGTRAAAPHRRRHPALALRAENGDNRGRQGGRHEPHHSNIHVPGAASSQRRRPADLRF